MAIIYSYPAESSPQPTDLILGTSTATVDGKQTNVTRTYTMQTITDYIKTLGGIGVESITFSAPLTGGTITQTGTVGIPQAGAASDGYLSSGDWTTFNSKLGGAAGVVDKIPVYTGSVTLGNSSLTEPTGGTTVTVGKTFAPAADATHDLGVTGTARWRNMFLSGTANAVDFSGTNLTITGTLSANGSTGTSGYILQSKGASAVEWVNLSSAYDTYDINVTTQGSDVDLNLTSTSGTDNSKVQITAGSGIVLTRNAAQQMTIERTADTYQGTVDEIDVNPTGAAFLTVTNGAPSSPSGKVTLNPEVGTVAAGQTGLVSGDAVNTAIQAALTGFVEFKGGFRADSGLITSGANAGSYLYNCPGGAGTRIAIAVGDYYVVETQGGDFYCDAAHTLTIGVQVICSTAAGADSSVLSNWTQIQENIDLATETTPGIANFPSTDVTNKLVITGGAVVAQKFSGAGTQGYVPDSTGSTTKFLKGDGTWSDGPTVGITSVGTGNGLTGGTIDTSNPTGIISPDYTSSNNIIKASGADLSRTLVDTDFLLLGVGDNVDYIELDQIKTYIGAGSGTVTTTGTPTTNTLPVFSSSSSITDSMLAQNAGATLLTNTGSFTTTSITDSLGSTGTANQVLTATASGGSIEWGAAAASYTKWIVSDGSSSSDVNDGDTVTFTTGTSGTSTGANDAISVSESSKTVTVVSNAFAGGANIGHVPSGGTAGNFLQGDGTWAAAGGGSRKVDTGTGDNTTIDFTMTQAFTSVDYVDVYISGVYQQKSTYTQPNGTGTTLLRFNTAPPVTASNGIDFVINY